MSKRNDKALSLMNQHFNCAQSVFLAYSDLFDLDTDTAFKLTSGFGGGIGGLGKT